MNLLQNPVFRLEISPEEGLFSIVTDDPALPDLLRCRLRVEYWLKGKKYTDLDRSWKVEAVHKEMARTQAHGDVDFLHYELLADKNGLGVTLDFGIVQEYPLVLWKAALTNQGSQPVNIGRVVMLELDAKRGKVQFSQAKNPEEMGFFSNGWQSWSPTQWYSADSQMHNSKLGRLQLPMIKNAGTPLRHKKGQFSSDFFAVIGDRKVHNGFLVGFLSQKEQFGTITCDFGRSIALKLWANGDNARLDPGKVFTTDWAVFNPLLLDQRDPLSKFTEAVARENNINLPAEVPPGWCSWYQYFTKVTAEDVRENLHAILNAQERLPMQLVQLDDGFETQVGDWSSFKDTFKGGVKPLAGEILSEGLIPGLWLAPFAVHPKSQLMQRHPDWILRTARGKPVNAGFGWGTMFTALDLTVPAALEYAATLVRTAVNEWGFSYLKLDFLYAAALPGKYADETQTRAQVMRRGMEAIRAAAGSDEFLLGCGAPLGSVLGLVNANRIGPDVSGDWTPRFAGIQSFIRDEPAMPCTRNSIRNIITRANLQGHWWVNDPDCLLIRPKSGLTLDEVRSLAAVIALSGGSLLISDELSILPADRLRIAESLIPVIGERARVVDWFDCEMPEKLRLDLFNESGAWHVLAAFNWDELARDFTLTPASFGLEAGEYWLCEFWSGYLVKFSQEKPALFRRVAAHGGIVCGVRRADTGQALYLGGDLHISQGMEVAEWQEDSKGVRITLRLPRTTEGNIILSVPRPAEKVSVNGEWVEVIKVTEELLQIPLKVEGFAHIEVVYGEESSQGLSLR